MKNYARTAVVGLCLALLSGCSTKGKDDAKSGKTGVTANKSDARDWPLDNYKGKNPVLLVMGESRGDFLSKLDQMDASAKPEGLVVIEIWDLKQIENQGTIRSGAAISKKAATDMRDAFGGNPNYMTVTLIGTDGEIVTKKSGDTVDPKSVFEKLP